MPDMSKDFPALNGVSLMSGPPSAPAATGPQIPLLERAPLPPQQQVQQPQLQQQQQQQQQQPPPTLQQVETIQQQGSAPTGEVAGGTNPMTAIFRPDDAGEWKEQLRLSHEAAEKARIERAAGALSTGAGWTQEEDETKEEAEEEDESAISEGEGSKVWKAKRTLRK
jgi:striatin 1/3/4